MESSIQHWKDEGLGWVLWPGKLLFEGGGSFKEIVFYLATRGAVLRLLLVLVEKKEIWLMLSTTWNPHRFTAHVHVATVDTPTLLP